MNERKKSIEQLKKDLSQKIKGIKMLLSNVFAYDYESEERLEYSNIIATSLRAILFGDNKNNYKSLIERVGYDKKLYFPLYDSLACVNLVAPNYNLLQFSIENNGIKTIISDNVFKKGGFWGTYLNYNSWINEVVIDTKLKNVEPLSRLLIIKIISDGIGAHVDDEIEEHIFNMSKYDLLPILIHNGNVNKYDGEAKTKFVFCETILAIAQELIDSYELFLGLNPKKIGLSNFDGRVQEYKCSNFRYKLYKYSAVISKTEFNTTINTYNSNSYYKCNIYSKIIYEYEIIYFSRLFKVIIIDALDIMKNGQYLGESIYGEQSELVIPYQGF